MPISITREQLIKEYVEDGDSTYVIAQRYNTYPNDILRHLKKWGIARRSYSQQQKLMFRKGRQHPMKGKTISEEAKKNRQSQKPRAEPTPCLKVKLRAFLYEQLVKRGHHVLLSYDKFIDDYVYFFDLYIPHLSTAIILGNKTEKPTHGVKIIHLSFHESQKDAESMDTILYEVLGALYEAEPFVKIEVD